MTVELVSGLGELSVAVALGVLGVLLGAQRVGQAPARWLWGATLSLAGDGHHGAVELGAPSVSELGHGRDARASSGVLPGSVLEMRRPAARPSEQIIVLYERVAAVLSTSAELADQHARIAARAGDTAYAALEQSRAQRARRSAEKGRRNARRLRLRAQADRIFGDPPRWRALFDAHDTPDALRLRGLEEAVIGTDVGGTVKLWNAAAERLYGWSPAEVLGRPITEITVGPQDTDVAQRIMASVRASGSWEGAFWVTRRDGTRFLAYVRDVAVADDDGQPLGLIGISIDLAPGLSDPAAATPAARAAPS